MFDQVLLRLRALVRGSKYVMTVHGHEEMLADGLTIFDVEHCLLTGKIVSRQKESASGEWKYVVQGDTFMRGKAVVIVKLGPTGKLVIITVYAL